MNPESLSEFLQLSSSQKLFFSLWQRSPELCSTKMQCVLISSSQSTSVFMKCSFIQRRRNLSLDETDLNVELKVVYLKSIR